MSVVESEVKDQVEEMKIEEPVEGEEAPAQEAQAAKKKKSEKDLSKSQRDKNKALRERYEETGGKGMKLEQIDRAKQLLRREERKNQKRRAADKQTKKEGSQWFIIENEWMNKSGRLVH